MWCQVVKLAISQEHKIFRCKRLCNTGHAACSRGVMPPNMVSCHTSFNALWDSTMSYVTFEQREVETFGKGKPFSRQEKVESLLSYDEFQVKLR